jgi:hypothetical protein
MLDSPNNTGYELEAELRGSSAPSDASGVIEGNYREVLASMDSDLMDEAQADDPGGHKIAVRQRVILPEDCTRALAVRLLAKSIQTNEYGLPIYYLRSDLLPYDLGNLNQGEVDAAVVQLSYDEGFPTTDKNQLFWSQMPHEPQELFMLFVAYLDQPLEVGIRQLELLAQSQRVELSLVTDAFYEYFWSARARAYDLFQVAADRKKRELRIRKSEDSDFVLASNMLEQLLERFNCDEGNWWDELTAKEALDALEQLVKLKRLSLGLTGQHASSLPRAGGSSVESVENIMKQLTNAGAATEASAMDVRALLLDPETATMAQSLIIKATRITTISTVNEQASFSG